MRRLAVLVALALLAAALAATPARAALFLLFAPASADAGELASIRLGGTPGSFQDEDRKPPLGKGIRVYLVPSEVAGEVGSRFDRRLHYVGRIVPDRSGRGLVRFRVPPLDSGRYAVAAWCPECARFSLGQRFFVQGVPGPRFRRWTTLRVRLPDPAARCPVSGEGTYGNGFLSVTVPAAGVLVRPREADGTLFEKLGWLPRKGFTGTLTVRGERLDADGELRVLSVNWGYATAPGRAPVGSWRSAVTFPSAGCWRLTGRVGDISLSYVVRVVAAP